MQKLIEQLKEYGPFCFILLSALVAMAISYGSSQATASITFDSHEKRINVLEIDDKQYGQDISSIKTDLDNTRREVHDLWLDNGHKEHR